MHTIHDMQQGTDSWNAHRKSHFNASEAPAVMGASKYTTRSELLREKATGIGREHDAATQRRFAAGHEAEAIVRAQVENLMGLDFYPVTASVTIDGLPLSASYDGLDMEETTALEIKLWNEDLASQIRAGDIEPHYYWQLEQQLLTVGAERVIFCTGNADRLERMEYRAAPGRREQLIAAWAQFAKDLAAYKSPEVVAPVAAAPVESLPAVSVRMDGALTVASNLPEFGIALRAFVERIPARPSTDQEFADTDAACKALKRAEDALQQAEDGALASMTSVEELRRIIGDLRTLARTTRLQREKMVEARKLEIRTEEVQRGKTALAEHIAELNAQIGKPYMPAPAVDFGAAIKGLRSLDSVRSAIDQTLANSKIAANEVAGKIQINMAALRELASAHVFLFADTAALVQKDPEACRAIITGRIAEHQAEEQKRAEALAEKERERIRAEEAAKLQREASEKARQEAEAARPAPTPAQAPIAPPAPVAKAQNVVPIQPRPAQSAPTLRLGVINERLAPISLSADGLARLGFQPAATDKAAKLYREEDFGAMCDALIAHIHAARCDKVAA